MGQDPTEPTQSMWPNTKKHDGIGTLLSYVSRKPHWNLVGLLEGHRKRLKKWSIKTKISKQKNTKNNLLPYFTPNVSNIHVIPKSWLLWSLHTNNVWEDRALGPPKQRCSNVSYARSQVRRPHNHIFVSPTIYFTLLHSLKTRLFINPVLNNPKTNELTLTLNPGAMQGEAPWCSALGGQP